MIQEECHSEESIDLSDTWPSKAQDWKKKHLRRAKPARVLKEHTTANGGHRDTPIRTEGESTRYIPTSEELYQKGAAESDNERLAGAVDHIFKAVVTPPHTDPLRRRAAERANESADEDEDVASDTAKQTSLTPVISRSKSKGHGVDESDVGLGSYIAQMRARGHQRSTSAPIRARLQTAPTNVLNRSTTKGEMENERHHPAGTEDVKVNVILGEGNCVILYQMGSYSTTRCTRGADRVS